jgi:hypothetical protein
MYFVHVLTRLNCTLDSGLVSRYRAIARLQLLDSFVPTLGLMLVVFVTVSYVIVTITKHKLVTFRDILAPPFATRLLA